MPEAQALIIYGNGLQALYFDDKNVTTDRKGVKVQPILVVPSDELMEKHDLREEDLNIVIEGSRRNGIWIDYPIKQIDWLNKSRTGAVLFIWCAFDRSRTPIMRKMDELLEWDEQRDRTESRLRAQVSTLQRELEDTTSNLAEILRQLKEYQDILSAKVEESGDEDKGG
jgi:hypothetical protein